MHQAAILNVRNLDMKKKVRIAITGCTGFIGSSLIDYLVLNDAADILAIVRKTSDLEHIKKLGLKYILYDGTISSLDKNFYKQNIDTVIHIATYYSYAHTKSQIDLIIDSNLKFGCHLLEAASNNNISNFINLGSYLQDYDFHSLYSVTKKAMQDMVTNYASNKKVNAITLKLCDVYGPNDRREKILNILKKSNSIEMTPGFQEIRLTHVQDVLSAIILALSLLHINTNKFEHRVYYVGAQAFSLRQVVDIFEKVSNKKLNIQWGAIPYREGVPLNLSIGSVLPGWEAKISLEQGIKDFLKK
jgi:nucleoside-diphosphate-sugar epimerase